MFAVAALVQPRAGSIYANRYPVFLNRKAYFFGWPAFLKPIAAVGAAQRFHHRFFNNGLAIRQAVQLGGNAVPGYGKRIGFG